MYNFGFVEIPTKDIAASCEFYRRLFGWNTGISKDLNYGFFWPATGIKGGFSPKDKPGSGVIVYIEAPDIDSVLDRVLELGGEIVHRKSEVGGGHGYVARFKDNMGNILGLWSKT